MFNASISNEFQFLVTKSIYGCFPSIPITQFPRWHSGKESTCQCSKPK